MPYIAPNSPVADWRCVPEGVGYGNYFDPVTGTWATVTRTTPKTARTADGRIVDVPAGKLALEPWSLHKEGGTGYAAIIEELRTNAYAESTFADTTALDTWTTDTGVSAAIDEGEPLYASGHNVVLSATEDGSLWRTITSTASARSISWRVRKANGTIPTEADCQIAAVGGTTTPASSLLTTVYSNQTSEPTNSYTSPNVEVTQGYCTDGTNHYLISNTSIAKLDSTWTTVATNTDPLSGIANVNHCGDGAYHDGKLYIPVERFATTIDFGSQYICVYDAVTLERISANDVSAQGHEVAGCAVAPNEGATGIIYVTSYCDGTQVFKYNLGDFSYVGTLALSPPGSAYQGIAYKDGCLYLSNEGAKKVTRVTPSGATSNYIVSTADAVEGLDFTQDELRWIVTTGASTNIRYYEPQPEWFTLSATYTGTATTWASGIVVKSGASIIVACPQDEAGSTVSSFIPTTSSAATRNADEVNIPAPFSDVSELTFVAVSSEPRQVTTSGVYSWDMGNERIRGYRNGGSYFGYARTVAGGEKYDLKKVTGPAVVAAAYKSGEQIHCYVDGASGLRTDVYTPPAGLPSTLRVGAISGLTYLYNGPIARLTAYNKALTNEQLAAADMTTDLLAGLDTARITNEVTL